jgi:hypothetical protein
MGAALEFLNIELPRLGKYAIKRDDIIEMVSRRTGKSKDSCAGTLSNPSGIFNSPRFEQWVPCRIHKLNNDEREKLAQQTYNGLSSNYGKTGHKGLFVHKDILGQHPKLEPQRQKDFHTSTRQEQRDHIFDQLDTNSPSIVLLPSTSGQDVITAQNRFRSPTIFAVEHDPKIFAKYQETKQNRGLISIDFCGSLLDFLKTRPDQQFDLISYDGAQYLSPTSIETLTYINEHKSGVIVACAMEKVVDGFRGNSRIAKEWRNKYNAAQDKTLALLGDTMSNYLLIEQPREWMTKIDGSRTMRLFLFRLRGT